MYCIRGLTSIKISIPSRKMQGSVDVPLMVVGASYDTLPENIMRGFPHQQITDYSLHTTDAPGQRWSFKFQTALESNVRRLSQHRLQKGTYNAQQQRGQLSIPVRMEANIFGPSGIAQVRYQDLAFLRGTCSSASQPSF